MTYYNLNALMEKRAGMPKKLPRGGLGLPKAGLLGKSGVSPLSGMGGLSYAELQRLRKLNKLGKASK